MPTQPKRKNETAHQIERVLLDRLFNAVKTCDNSVLLRTYSPCANCSFASLILDFTPKLTVALLKQVMRWLEKPVYRSNNSPRARKACMRLSTV